MLCSIGFDLLHAYQDATSGRATAADNLLLSPQNRDQCEELLYAARKTYSNAFVNWVTHRSFCIDCRTESVSDDRILFASV